MSLCYECASFRYMPTTGTAGPRGRRVPIFWETDILISIVYKFVHPPAMEKCSNYSISSQAQTVLYVFILRYFDRWKMIFQSFFFIWISLMVKDVERLLTCLSAIWDSSVEYSLLRSVFYLFIGLVGTLMTGVLSSYIFWRLFLCLNELNYLLSAKNTNIKLNLWIIIQL